MKNDFAKLEHWTALFKQSKVLLEYENKALAQTALALVKEGFKTETDPYGKRWKPKKRPDGRKVLHGPTGRLRRGWRVRAISKTRGFTLVPSVDYATPHQDARRGGRLPRRMMVPASDRGLPASWRKALHAVSMKTMRAYYSGKTKGK